VTLTEERLQTLLAPRSVRFLLQVNSTNDVALEWLRDEGAPSGAVVVADEQLHGRGRLKRVWYTPPDSALALSVILRPNAKTLPQINMLGALSVYDLLQELGVEKIGIKWPNDVQINGLKVCGILSEAAWDGDTLLGVALGIGVNIRVDLETVSPDLVGKAVNLETVLGKHLDRSELIASLLKHIDVWTKQLDNDELFQTWKQRLNTIGRQVVVTTLEGEKRGFVDNVLKDGWLVIIADDGTRHEIMAGDVTLRVEG
jgi:BirA family transcriptional regulator, biotin operon repressor / biotin---[acetyl-CoA-carboxylase] ligase